MLRRINSSALLRQVRHRKKARFKTTVLRKSTQRIHPAINFKQKLKDQFPTSKRKRTKFNGNAWKATGHSHWEEPSRAQITIFGDIFYRTSLNAFGDKQHQVTREPGKSRRQREMKTVQTEEKSKKKINLETEEEKNGLQELWRGLKTRHSAAAEQNSQGRVEVKRKITRHASSKIHSSSQDNSSCKQDEHFFQNTEYS